MLMSIIIALFLNVPKQETVNPYPNSHYTALVIKADLVDCKNTPPIVKKDQVLLPVNIAQKYFDPYIYYDQKMNRIVITNKNRVVKMKLDSKIISVNNELCKSTLPARKINGTFYIPISFLKNMYGISVKYNKTYNVVLIDYNADVHKKIKVTQLVSNVRKSKFIASPVIKKLKFNDELEVYDAYNGWYKVKSSDGIIGYTDAQTVQLVANNHPKSKTKPKPAPKKITLAWDQNLNPSSLNKIDGLQILSPFWFYVSDKNGTVKSKAQPDTMKAYVARAHKLGYKVWVLCSNSFSPIISSSVLNDGNLKDKVIHQLVAYAKQYNLDGINVDFENMHSEDRDAYTQFMRELAPLLRAQGRTITVDVGAPNGNDVVWGCYDPKTLATITDYVAVMTYDEHWSNCPYSGSVAQYSWVEDKLNATLDAVPAEKLLLGIPFYARGWREELNQDGTTKVTQYKVFTIAGAKNEVKANNASVRWDTQSGQLYAQFSRNNAVYKIWLEDENSINLKSSLIQKYNLAGAAIWEKSYAEPGVWKVLKNNLQQKQNYAQWIKCNKKLYARLHEFYLANR